MTTFDPRYEAVMVAKAAVQAAAAGVDAATTARPFNPSTLADRLDTLIAAGRTLQAAHQTTQDQEHTP